ILSPTYHIAHSPTPFPYTTLFRSEAWTPSILLSFFSTRAAHDVQVMPLTSSWIWPWPLRSSCCVDVGVLMRHPPAHIRPHRRPRSEEHTSELQSRFDLVCRLLLEK